jgi:hypothetical protein
MAHAFFQRLSRTFRRGDKRAEFLQSPGLRHDGIVPLHVWCSLSAS